MRKDLPIDILSAVEKPARYTGMEFGSIVKPEEETEVSFVWPSLIPMKSA